MIDRDAFCAKMGIDAEAAAAALSDTDSGAVSPWYVRAFLAVGAWVTAIAIIVFFGVFLALVLSDSDAVEGVLTVLGLLCFGGGIALLAKATGGAFQTSFATALAAAGSAMTVAGVGIAAEDIWLAAFASVMLAGVVIALAPSWILQILVSGLAVVLTAVALIEQSVPYYLDVSALALVAGVALWCRPPRVDIRPTAFVLLLMAPVLAIFFRFAGWHDVPPGGWVAVAVHIALFAWLITVLWRRTPERTVQTELAVFAGAAAAVCLLLPPGGSGALVILTLAFVLGSWPLALLGALLQAYFFWQFYYDLQISLLNKSFLLAAVGAIVLVCWWLIAGRKPGEAAP